jgi:hypothetical protein
MNLKLIRFFDKYWILLVMVAIKLILQFVLVNPIYELHRDEFLHLDQANHLAFGFISVQPFTSLIAKIIFFLGGNMFWIRFFPALFGTLTIVFVWLIVESIDGCLFSKILASSALLFSPLMRINLLFHPNSFDILAWTIIFFLLIKFVQSENPKWLFYLSIIIAIGLYNKYSVVFLIVGLVVSFLITDQRRLLLNSSILKAILITTFLLLPNLIWQVVHHFPVLYHMKALKETQLDNNTSFGFLINQLLFFFGSLPLTLGALVAFIYFKPFKQFRFIGIGYILIIALFAYLKAKGYYAVGLYPVLIAFGSVFIESILSNKLKMIIFPLLISINLFMFITTVKFFNPILTPSEIRQNSTAFEKQGLLRWEDGKNHTLPQDFADMIGWREMADKALIAYKMIPENELKNTLIICDNYGQAGALNYYNRTKMPEAYSYKTDYIYWLPHLNTIQNILLIGSKPNKEVIDMFKDFILVGVVENEFAREKNTPICLLIGANTDVTESFYKLIEERKKKFDIF